VNNSRIPILVAPRLKSNATPVDELFQRFELYGRQLGETTQPNPKKFHIFGNIPSINLPIDSNFIDYRFAGKGFFKSLIFTAKFLLRNPKTKFSLIAGDIWLGNLLVFFLKLMFAGKLKSQVSLHGLPNFSNNLVVKIIKIFVFKLLIKDNDSIRVVSTHLGDYLVNTFKIDRSKIFVAPIPIVVRNIIKSNNRSTDLAIIGRLHKERGLRLACQVIENCLRQKEGVSTVIIGSGPEVSFLNDWIQTLPNPSSVSHLGQLSNSEVMRKLGATKILLNCAPTEGYGLAMREALILGTFVLAYRNETTFELSQNFPDAVFLFSEIQEACEIINNILSGGIPKFDNIEIMNRQINLDNESLKVLIDSWIK
jgi:glycosyltransferase involved in cell wall biosynthesis